MLTPRKGFTIVELLIVIVVIGVLAAITIVVFSGIQNRSKVVSITSDLSAVNRAIQAYKAENGNYPITGTQWYGWTNGVQTVNYVPGLVPQYINKLPLARYGSDEYIYRSDDGTEYKLISHDLGGQNGSGTGKLYSLFPASMRDGPRAYAAGYWSPNGSGI